MGVDGGVHVAVFPMLVVYLSIMVIIMLSLVLNITIFMFMPDLTVGMGLVIVLLPMSMRGLSMLMNDLRGVVVAMVVLVDVLAHNVGVFDLAVGVLVLLMFVGVFSVRVFYLFMVVFVMVGFVISAILHVVGVHDSTMLMCFIGFFGGLRLMRMS